MKHKQRIETTAISSESARHGITMIPIFQVLIFSSSLNLHIISSLKFLQINGMARKLFIQCVCGEIIKKGKKMPQKLFYFRNSVFKGLAAQIFTCLKLTGEIRFKVKDTKMVPWFL